MKKIILILAICLVPLTAMGFMFIGGRPAASSSSCDDCSGTLTFAAHFENSDDVTSGTPCGCSDDDEVGDRTQSAHTPTYVSTPKKDGSYALDTHYGNTYIHFDDNGTITDFYQSSFAVTYKFWVYVEHYYDDNGKVFSSRHDGDNYVRLKVTGASDAIDFGLEFEESDTGVHVTVTADSDCSDQTWYYVVAKVRSGSTNPSMGVWVYSDEESTLVDSATSDTDLHSFHGDEANFLRIGNVVSADNGTRVIIDDFKVWKEWK
jgi:hypothetical protein